MADVYLDREASEADALRRENEELKARLSNIKFHASEGEAIQEVHAALEKAQQDGKWLVAVWSVQGQTLHLRTRTTWNFPRGDYGGAIQQLQRQMREETELPTHERLPVAELPPPKMPLPMAELASIGEPENQN